MPQGVATISVGQGHTILPHASPSGIAMELAGHCQWEWRAALGLWDTFLKGRIPLGSISRQSHSNTSWLGPSHPTSTQVSLHKIKSKDSEGMGGLKRQTALTRTSVQNQQGSVLAHPDILLLTNGEVGIQVYNLWCPVHRCGVPCDLKEKKKKKKMTISQKSYRQAVFLVLQ